ncbi:hypothetical protein [Methylotenera sp.]|uniref:hypothetical protein n=1 Tax=Methylotenera sp. TaxID=2051956 RepID=UPI002733C15E|nr:hypothetical protein [Methylotenera sp.]MDP3308290.1 hypothetical protein [Methylotenera sp.]
MLDAATLKPVFAEKLLTTGSMDAALLKVIWLAYSAGLVDGAAPPITYDFGDNRCLPSSASTVKSTEGLSSSQAKALVARARVARRASPPLWNTKKNPLSTEPVNSSTPLKDLLTARFKSQG